jgi:hypothetical protein
LCQWQLQRMEEPTKKRSPRKPRRVTVE